MGSELSRNRLQDRDWLAFDGTTDQELSTLLSGVGQTFMICAERSSTGDCCYRARKGSDDMSGPSPVLRLAFSCIACSLADWCGGYGSFAQ